MHKQPYFDGPPRFDVGLKPIALSAWILPDDQAAWIVAKNALIDRATALVFEERELSRPAQQEAGDLIAAELGGRLSVEEAPLLAAARLVSDDFVIMEQRDGAWSNTACCLCSPTFFSAGHAIGKSLHALHDPVPDGDFGLATRIGRVFTNLPAQTVLERHNWTVQYSDARFTPTGAPLRAQALAATTEDAAAQLFLRVERQTIRRLPRTKAILFTIRIRLSPLAALLQDPHHATAFSAAWHATPDDVRRYKNWAVLERHVAALLARIA